MGKLAPKKGLFGLSKRLIWALTYGSSTSTAPLRLAKIQPTAGLEPTHENVSDINHKFKSDSLTTRTRWP
jgi:hypothetical protein